MISYLYNGKEIRICLECFEGIIIGDTAIEKTQKVYCSNCGTEHSYKINKKREVTIKKFDKKLSKEKLEELNNQNRQIALEFAKAVIKEFKITEADLNDKRKY